MRSVIQKKRGAFEMSITTIVILVIAMTMLILGMILVRNLMCKSIGLTSDVADKSRAQIDDLFQSTGGEVQCIGAGTTPVDLIPGKPNYIWCGIRASNTASYTITLIPAASPLNVPSGWIVGSSTLTTTVSPGDTSPKKVLLLQIPKEADEKTIRFTAQITRAGTRLSDQQLDFQVRRLDWFRGSVC
jgi:hypothetical protein